MNWYVRFGEQIYRRHPGAGVWSARVRRQPGWVLKTAVTATILVVVVPVVLITLAAVGVGVACFLVLSLARMAIRGVAALFNPNTYRAQDDGRRNVEIIDRS